MKTQKAFHRFLLTVLIIPYFLQLKTWATPEIGDPWRALTGGRDNAVYVRIDTDPPKIENLTHSPWYPQDRDRVIINATVTDNGSGVKKVVLEIYSHVVYSWFGMNWGWGNYAWEWFAWEVWTTPQNLTMMHANSTYSAEILEQRYRTQVFYRVYAFDNAGNAAVSDIHSFYVVHGVESIVYSQVSSALNWIVYISVALIMVAKVRRKQNMGEENKNVC